MKTDRNDNSYGEWTILFHTVISKKHLNLSVFFRNRFIRSESLAQGRSERVTLVVIIIAIMKTDLMSSCIITVMIMYYQYYDVMYCQYL